MTKVILTRVFRKDVETKYGIKPKISIQTQTHGDKWLSSFNTKGTENWNEGQEVEIDVSEKGDFLNFKPRGGANGASPDTEKRLAALEKAVFGGSPPEAEIVAEDEDGF